jgi:hypothetical protein
LNQLTLALILICRSSYRGAEELLRDLFDTSISVGAIHNRLRCAAGQAATINRSQNLSAIRVGLLDEIFQGSTPVLAGVDAASTYCYLLADAEHRDADTWGVHLLDAHAQGFDPDHTIADAGQGLRAGQKAALSDTPCHGVVFHIQKQCETLANVLARVAIGATSRRKALDVKMDVAKENSRERKADSRSPDTIGEHGPGLHDKRLESPCQTMKKLATPTWIGTLKILQVGGGFV